LIVFSKKNEAQMILVSPEDEKLSIDYYKMGTTEMQNGNFVKADSILTLSINLLPYKDNLFNRSIARMALNDTCGFCNDVLFASKFDDKESEKLYNDFCQKSDTTFYNRKMDIVNNDEYRYYKVQSIIKCTGDTIVIVHDKKSKGKVYRLSYGPITSPEPNWIDIIGIYKMVNNREVYVFLIDKPRIVNESNPIIKFINDNLDLSPDIKRTIKINFIVTPEGKISDYELFPEDLSGDLKQKITLLIYSMTEIKPAKILGKKVYYEFSFILDNSYSIQDVIQIMN